MILSFWTDRSGQTVKTQIRQFWKEQSDQGLHCLLFRLHLLNTLLCGKATVFKCLSNVWMIKANVLVGGMFWLAECGGMFWLAECFGWLKVLDFYAIYNN